MRILTRAAILLALMVFALHALMVVALLAMKPRPSATSAPTGHTATPASKSLLSPDTPAVPPALGLATL